MWASRFDKFAISVDGSLEANIVRIPILGSLQVFIISLDALYVSRDLIGKVAELVSGIVPPESLVFCASHTHFGPILSSDKPGLGDVVPDGLVDEIAAQIAESIRSEVESIVGVASNARNIAPFESFRLRQGAVGEVINRRRRRWLVGGRQGISFNQITMSPNKSGRTNSELSLIECLDTDGELSAIIWSWTCHPTAYPNPGVASPEYPGYVRDHLRKHYGKPDLPVIFFQGFSGDQRPPEPTRPRSTKQWILRVLRGPTFQPFTPDQYWAWVDEIKQGVDRLLETEPRELKPNVSLTRSHEPIENFIDTETKLPDVQAVRLQLADELAIVGVSAEVVLDHSDHVKQTWPESTNICAGCVGDVYGYMATSSMVPHGGYEVDGFCTGFGYAPGKANPNIDSAFLRLMKKLKR